MASKDIDAANITEMKVAAYIAHHSCFENKQQVSEALQDWGTFSKS